MSYIVDKWKTSKTGVKLGPYQHEVETVRDGDKVVQRHIRYLGKGGVARRAATADTAREMEKKNRIPSLRPITAERMAYEEMTDEQKEIADAVTIWSAGSVDVVREPGDFSEEQSEGLVNIAFKETPEGNTSNYGFIPDAEAYKKANVIIEDLASAPLKMEPGESGITRGMSLSAEEVAAFEVNSVFDLGTIASFSKSELQSEDFAFREVRRALINPNDPQSPRRSNTDDFEYSVGGETARTRFSKMPVMLKMDSGDVSRGTEITGIAAFPLEREFLSSGSAQVKSIKFIKETRQNLPIVEIEITHT